MFNIFKSVPNITSDELVNKLKNPNNVLIDVRTTQEYRLGHIKGANNIPLNRLNTYQGDKEKAYYVICQSGVRSKKAVKYLQKQGYSVWHVLGGMNAWRGKVIGGK